MIETILFGLLVGLSLGLTGGGGSIFAVPLLVFGLQQDFRSAVAISLAVVGLTALYGAILQARHGNVLWRAGAVLGFGGILAAPLGAAIGSRMSESISLILFAGLMIFIGIRMLVRKAPSDDAPESWITCRRKLDGTPEFSTRCAANLVGAGAVAGVLSGVFGVGGGFLVVPALLVVTQVPIERALATSLVAIFLIAAAGYAANSGSLPVSHWAVTAPFLAGAAIGMTGGVRLKNFIPSIWLARLFGGAIIATALWILATKLI